MINEIGGLCLESGVVLTSGAAKVKSSLCAVIADGGNELTTSSRESMQDLYDEFVDVEFGLKKLDTRIRQLCRHNESCKRILKIPDIGKLNTTAIVAAVPDPKAFRNDRHMSSWLGLVPRQSFNGDKQVFLGISKRGDRYLRSKTYLGDDNVKIYPELSHWLLAEEPQKTSAEIVDFFDAVIN